MKLNRLSLLHLLVRIWKSSVIFHLVAHHKPTSAEEFVSSFLNDQNLAFAFLLSHSFYENNYFCLIAVAFCTVNLLSNSILKFNVWNHQRLEAEWVKCVRSHWNIRAVLTSGSAGGTEASLSLLFTKQSMHCEIIASAFKLKR